MTTSGIYSFNVSRNEVIRQAMLNLLALDPDENPTDREISDCAFLLNMIVKQWQGNNDFGKGLKVWTRRRGHLYLNSAGYQYLLGPSGTGWAPDASYATTSTSAAANAAATAIQVASTTGIATGYHIGVIYQASGGPLTYLWTTVVSVVGSTVNLTDPLPGDVAAGAIVVAYQTTATQPIVLESVVLRDDQGNDIPVRVLRTVQDYDILPAKTNPSNISDPGAVYLEFQLENSNLFTDVAAAADVTKHLVFTYLEAVMDITDPADNPEFPQEYFLALVWELANQACSMFGATWTQDMQAKYEMATAIAKKKDPEVSTTFFQPGED